MDTQSPVRLLILPIAWGLFCACSWTWCIGMFMPKIMIDRFGWWGFIAFAVPNVIGCTAFGYVVGNRARSEAMVRRHTAGMIAFSAATVGYHVFFVTLLFEILAPQFQNELAPLAAAVTLIAIGLVFSFLSTRDWLVLAVVVYGVSIALFSAIGFEPLARPEWSGRWSFTVLAWLSPVIVLGFLVCPYLDLTFHRAIQFSPSRHAFGVFGVTFSVMIVLSVALWFADPPVIQQWWFMLAVSHLLAQSVFTVGAHLREIRVSAAFEDSAHRWLVMLAPLAAAPLLIVGRMISDSPVLGENMYIGFVVLYGSAFPIWFIWRHVRTRQRKTPGRAGG